MPPSRQAKKTLRPIKERMYGLIDHATAENLSAPNFALYTDIAGTISSSSDPQYLSDKACKQMRKRLLVRKGRAQALTLQLLEHCVRTCGEPFHRELASSELLPELVRMTDQTAWCPPEVQQQVLSLLQEWAYTLRPSAFVNTYNKLRARGTAFPSRTGPASPYGPPAGSPAASFQPYPGLSPPPPQQQPGSAPGVNPAADLFGAGELPGSPGAPSTPARGSALLSPDQPPAKLRADLEVARNTVALLQEVLAGVPEDDPAGVKEDYVADMAEQVRAMRGRLTALIERLNDEALLGSALELNDEAQRALERYGALVDVAEGRRGPPPRRATVTNGYPPAASALAGAPAARPASAPQPAPTPAPAPQPPAQSQIMADLLSLDDWTPDEPAQPLPSWPAPASTQPAGGLSPASSAPPAPSAAPPAHVSNNPFAEVGAPAPAFPPAPLQLEAPTFPPAPLQLEAPAAAAAQPDAASNPFFSDAAWSPSEPSARSQTAQAPTPEPAAAPSPLVASAPSPLVASAPSPLVASAPSPLPAPLGGLPSATSAPASSNPFASASAPPSARSANPFGGSEVPSLDLSSVGQPGLALTSPATSYPTLFSEAPTSGRSTATVSSVPQLSDAFEGLVSLQKKADEPPPLPKGSPMRRGPSGNALAPPPALEVNGGDAGPSSSAPSPLDAFSAFDSIASPQAPGSLYPKI